MGAGLPHLVDPGQQRRRLPPQVMLAPDVALHALEIPVSAAFDRLGDERSLRRLQKGRLGLGLNRLIQELGVKRLNGLGKALEGHGRFSGSKLYAGFKAERITPSRSAGKCYSDSLRGQGKGNSPQ